MKLLLIICSGERIDEVLRIIDEHEVHTFTELDGLRGSGATGRHLGTRAFPGAVSLIFTAVPATKAAELVDALRQFSQQCSEGEGIRVFEMDVTAAI
jgi:hypothetical protein